MTHTPVSEAHTLIIRHNLIWSLIWFAVILQSSLLLYWNVYTETMNVKYFNYCACCVHQFYKTELNELCIVLQYEHRHTHTQAYRYGTHIPTPNERQKGMAGLTDQFPISPSRPAVIRSSYTWREAWIPLGFISSNYPLLPPHAVLLLAALYFSFRSWHCPPRPPSFLLFHPRFSRSLSLC